MNVSFVQDKHCMEETFAIAELHSSERSVVHGIGSNASPCYIPSYNQTATIVDQSWCVCVLFAVWRFSMHKFIRVCIITFGLLLGTTVTSQAQPSPAPRVWSITVVEDTHTDDSVSFRVTFSEPVSGVDVSDFSIAGDSQYPRIAKVSTSARADSFTVEVTFQSPGTKLALALLDDDSIVNAAQIPLGGIGAQNGNAISPAVAQSAPTQTGALQTTESRADTSIPRSVDID
jgi:hypothetical protein